MNVREEEKSQSKSYQRSKREKKGLTAFENKKSLEKR